MQQQAPKVLATPPKPLAGLLAALAGYANPESVAHLRVVHQRSAVTLQRAVLIGIEALCQIEVNTGA